MDGLIAAFYLFSLPHHCSFSPFVCSLPLAKPLQDHDLKSTLQVRLTSTSAYMLAKLLPYLACQALIALFVSLTLHVVLLLLSVLLASILCLLLLLACLVPRRYPFVFLDAHFCCCNFCLFPCAIVAPFVSC